MSIADLGGSVIGSSQHKKARFHVRWVLAHEPTALFEPAAREFARLVSERTAGEMRVDVLSLADYSPGRRLDISHMLGEVRSGRLEMAQIQAQEFGLLHAPAWVVDAPFIFKSHEHVVRVVDGEIGRRLMDALIPHGLRALAFTYSGGERILATSGAVLRRHEDLRGLRVRTTPSPVAQLTMEALGASPVPAPIAETIRLSREGRIDASETTYARYWDQRQYEVHPVVHETGHSVLLTAMVLSDAYFAALPKDFQDAVSEAGRVVAVKERADSLEAGRQAKAQAEAKGLKIVALDPAERARFEQAARAADPRIEALVGAQIVSDIRALA